MEDKMRLHMEQIAQLDYEISSAINSAIDGLYRLHLPQKNPGLDVNISLTEPLFPGWGKRLSLGSQDTASLVIVPYSRKGGPYEGRPYSELPRIKEEKTYPHFREQFKPYKRARC